MRRSLGVGVSRVAMVDGTGQGVQLLEWYPKSHPHVSGDQVSAGHADITETLQNKLFKLTKLKNKKPKHFINTNKIFSKEATS